MAIESHKLGDGSLTLKIGTDAAKEFSQQVRSITLTPAESVTTEEDIEVLSGETLYGEDTVTHDAVLAGKILQDFGAAGFTAFTWANRGALAAFVFTPITGVGAKVEGTCRIVPTALGGDVKSRLESDFSFPTAGAFPTFTPSP